MNLTHCVSLFVGGSLLSVSLTAHAEGQLPPPLEIKGFSPGQALEACPPETLSEQRTPGGVLTCTVPLDTLGNLPVKNMAVMIWESKVLAVLVEMRNRSKGTAAGLRSAFVEKYGEPNKEHQLLSFYIWERGAISLAIDGARGTVMVADMHESERMKAQRAKRSRGDL